MTDTAIARGRRQHSTNRGADMESVKLGSQGAVVSRMGLGCMGMSEFYGTRDDAESAATILRSLDLGMTFLDTADMYGTRITICQG